MRKAQGEALMNLLSSTDLPLEFGCILLDLFTDRIMDVPCGGYSTRDPVWVGGREGGREGMMVLTVYPNGIGHLTRV